MAFDVEAFARSREGRYLDLDAAFGAQCHDLWLDQLYALGGLPGEGHAPGLGHTVNVFYQFPTYRPGLQNYFTKHHGSAGIRPGDVLFWKVGKWFPGSHTAMALAAPQNGMVYCLTQNPGPVKRAYITLNDLVGYLRPIALNNINTQPPATSKDTDMATTQNSGVFYRDPQTRYWVYIVFNTQSGFYRPMSWSEPEKKFDDGLLLRLTAAFNLHGTGFFQIEPGLAPAIEASCAQIRTGK